VWSGFTGDSQSVLYLVNISGFSNHLQSQSSMGGGMKDLAQNVTDWMLPQGSPGAVVLTSESGSTSTTTGTFTITFVNALSGHASPVLATNVPPISSGGVLSMNKNLVWVTAAGSSPGIFAAPIP
jgi:hypothetical protein